MVWIEKRKKQFRSPTPTPNSNFFSNSNSNYPSPLQLQRMTITSLQSGFLSECIERPWGFYASTFAKKGFKTKVFVVKPRHRLSLQSHEHRHELWTIVSGKGICTVDDKVFEVSNDSFVIVPKCARHRIENISEMDDLIIAEVQVGDYISESDIVRYQDDYGRGK